MFALVAIIRSRHMEELWLVGWMGGWVVSIIGRSVRHTRLEQRVLLL